ncbi:MAG: hypothetical protein KC486_19275, partial [Myxococcales bacterium]|nr:hypothetical protein [Myxococcales bacterium]
NCGVGMILYVDRDAADAVAADLRGRGETVFRVGEVVPRSDLAEPAEQVEIIAGGLFSAAP